MKGECNDLRSGIEIPLRIVVPVVREMSLSTA